MKNILIAFVLLTACATENGGSWVESDTAVDTATQTQNNGVRRVGVATDTDSQTPTETVTSTETSTETSTGTISQTQTQTQTQTPTETTIDTSTQTVTATSTVISTQTTVQTSTKTTTYTYVDASVLTITNTVTVTATQINGKTDYCALPIPASIGPNSDLECYQQPLPGKTVTVCPSLTSILKAGVCEDIMPVNGQIVSGWDNNVRITRSLTSCEEVAKLSGCSNAVIYNCGFCAKTCGKC